MAYLNPFDPDDVWVDDPPSRRPFWGRLPKLRVPQGKPGQFAVFYAIQFLSYALVVANTRAYTESRYLWTAATDLAFGLQAFLVTKLMVDCDADQRGFWAGLGYTVGGTSGSLAAIWLTLRIYGK